MVSADLVLIALFSLTNAGFVMASGLIVGYAQRPDATILHTRAVYALAGCLGGYTIASLLGTLYGFAYQDAALLLLAAWLVAVVAAVLFLVATVLLARDFIHFRRRETRFGERPGGGFERARD